jgi:hypothetical protein
MNTLFVRTAGAVGVVSLAMFLLGVTPFLAAEPTVGAGFIGKTQGVVVDRSLKGDRLPVAGSGTSDPSASSSTVRSDNFRSQQRSAQRRQIPVGCEAAFSPISAPSLAHVYRRCMT